MYTKNNFFSIFNNNVKQIFFCFVFLTFLLSSTSASAFFEPENFNLEQTFIDSNKEISQWFDGVTEGLDLFIVGKKLTNKKNPSGFRIENTTVSRETDNFKNYTELKLNVRLQNLEQFMQLQFETTDDSNSYKTTTRQNLTSQNTNKKYAASVGFFKNLGKVRTSFKPRIELTNPLRVSHTLAFESVAELKNIKINPKIELNANAKSGLGTLEALNFNKKINDTFSWTILNEYEYFEKTHFFSGTNGFSLGQIISDRKTLSYNFYLESNNRPHYHLDSYDLGITYSKIIYKNMLGIQVTPHLNFPKVNSFKGIAGLIFTLSMNF